MKRELRAVRRTADRLKDYEVADDPHRSINFIFEQVEAVGLDAQPDSVEGALLAV